MVCPLANSVVIAKSECEATVPRTQSFSRRHKRSTTTHAHNDTVGARCCDTDDAEARARATLEKRRAHIASIFNMRHANAVQYYGVSFPRCDPAAVVETVRQKIDPATKPAQLEALQAEKRQKGITRAGCTFEETRALARQELRRLGPTPFPLAASLRKLTQLNVATNTRDLAFRKATEIQLSPSTLLPAQRPWVINTNVQFHLGITNINLNAWAKLLKLPFFSNNSCFRSLDISILYPMAGDECAVNIKIYSQGVVVMIGIRPIEATSACAHRVVHLLREQGIACSVNNLVVNNIVVGFDLGESLNLEQMLKTHPEKVERDYVLPMLTYFYSGKRRMRAFLFRTGRGLMPGVRSVDEASAMFPEIYRDARPFLYSGDNVLESTEIVNVTGMLQESADLEDMLTYLETERPDMVKDNTALSSEFQRLLRDLGDLDE